MTEDFEDFELSDEYKVMMDEMLRHEEDGTAKYVTLDEIISLFEDK